LSSSLTTTSSEADERRDDADVRLVAGGKNERALAVFPFRDRIFEFGVRAHVAGDETRGSRARAIAFHRFLRGGDHRGMRRQSEVVVRAEEQDAPAVDLDGAALLGLDGAKPALEARRPDSLELVLQRAVQRVAHFARRAGLVREGFGFR
jgi:hypothetical protein